MTPPIPELPITVIQTIRVALRVLRRRPTYALTALAALTLGIGGTGATLSVVDAVLLRPLPFAESSRLLRLEPRLEREPTLVKEVSYPGYREWREAADGFGALAAYASGSGGMALALDGRAVQLGVRVVTANLLTTLDVEPLAGRIFREEADGRGSERVVVLGEGPWRRHFGGDPGVVGTTVTLGGDRYRVVGILPRGVEYPRGAEAWVPVESVVDPGFLDDPGVGFLNPVGRVAPGVTPAGAVASLNAVIDATTDAAGPGANRVEVAGVPLREQLVGDLRRPLLLLLAGGGVLLLVASLNVANLQLVRTLERTEELALRSALGASGRALAGSVLAESALLVVGGGALGLSLAGWLTPVLVGAAPVDLYREETVTVHAGIAAATVGIAAAVTLLSGLIPAIRASLLRTAGVLRSRGAGGPGGARGGRKILGGVLVGQVALVTFLLVGAGLLARSWAELASVETGFARSGVLTVDVSLAGSGHEEKERADRFYDRLLERIRALPGVEAAGGVLLRPLEGPVGFDFAIHVEGRSPAEEERYPFLNYEAATPGYFRAAGLELLRGRALRAGDDGDAPGVAVVSEAVARRFWPDGDALGARFKLGPADSSFPWITIVGVVEDARYRSLEEASLDVYVPYRQSPWALGYLVVRTATETGALVPAVRREIHALDPDVHPVRAATTGELVSDALARPRFVALLLLFFAGAALALGSVGTYGVVAYAAVLRRGEIGVRLALGATPVSVARSFLLRGAGAAALGALLGLGTGAVAGGAISSLLFRVRPTDPLVLLGVPAIVAGMAVVASWIPARRAASVDPARTLRTE